jgi:hypothetical protein
MRFAALLFLSSLYSVIAQASSLPTEVIENMDRHMIVLYLSDAEIKAIPQWRPGEGAPPMSLQAAVERVVAWKAGEESLKDAHIYEVKYKPVHHYEKLNRWYYLIELRLPAGKKRFVAVLPNGQVVPAIEEPGR